MTDTVFDPRSWAISGDAFTQESADIAAKVTSTLGSMDVEALGCTRGGHAADVALSLVVPPILEVFTETIEGIAEGLRATGEMMDATGTAYAQTESANTDAGQTAASA